MSAHSIMSFDHQCYYCEQIFESKEELYDHLEVHAETESEQLAKKKKKTE